MLLIAIGGCASGGGDEDAGGIDAGTIAFCGDGVPQSGEECDGDAVGSSCEAMGYLGGTLACASDCTLDKSGCLEASCGNGAIDPGEACDGAANDATCESEGFVSGTIACGTDCQLDTSDCDACGDGSVDPGEECDGSPPAGVTCADVGPFLGGTLACDETCGVDSSGCFDAECGDGVRGGSEDCDGSDHGGRTCANYGFFAGELTCNSDCTFDTVDCHNCGNGRIEGIEQCDGAELGGADCISRGFTMGELRCAGCVYDTTGCMTAACGNGRLESGEACDDGNGVGGDGCTACAVDAGFACSGTPSSCSAICGNGMIHGSEECDGANLAGQTCVSRGYTSGTLRCSACSFDETGCTLTSCANGTIDAGEECDDGDVVRFDGCDPTCNVDAGFHLPVRLRNGEGSNHGMVEIFFGGAWRWVCDDTYDTAAQGALASVVCRQLGYTGTGHQFLGAFGGGSGGPAMDDVVCTGGEATLAQCAFRGWNQHNCTGVEAVGVRCVPAEGDIRLVAGPHGMEGRLQIFHTGAWGEVCDDYFDGAYGTSYYGYSTTTVCQQLGYRGGTFVSTYDAPTDTFVLDDVNCTGSERRIGDCPHLAYGTENCWTGEGAGFRCDVHVEGDLRLAGGTARNSGRVEILHQNVWGTVCDDFLTSADARQSNFVAVGCGQLGFERAGSALLYSAVPDGIDPVWMDDLSCAGSETSLGACPFLGWGMENCAHSEDIGLSCTP